MRKKGEKVLRDNLDDEKGTFKTRGQQQKMKSVII